MINALKWSGSKQITAKQITVEYLTIIKGMEVEVLWRVVDPMKTILISRVFTCKEYMLNDMNNLLQILAKEILEKNKQYILSIALAGGPLMYTDSINFQELKLIKTGEPKVIKE